MNLKKNRQQCDSLVLIRITDGMPEQSVRLLENSLNVVFSGLPTVSWVISLLQVWQPFSHCCIAPETSVRRFICLWSTSAAWRIDGLVSLFLLEHLSQCEVWGWKEKCNLAVNWIEFVFLASRWGCVLFRCCLRILQEINWPVIKHEHFLFSLDKLNKY